MSNDWTIFDEYEAQRNIQIEAFKNDLSRDELEKRPNVIENVWIKDNEASWYRENMYHTFKDSIEDSEIRFELSRREVSKINDPLIITIIDGFKTNNYSGNDALSLPFNGDETAAKKMIKNSIEYFDQKQMTSIYSIKDYLFSNKTNF
jgi:hypothetical protein